MMSSGPLLPTSLDALRQAATPEQRQRLVRSAPSAWHAPLLALLDGPETNEALIRAQSLPAPLWESPWSPRLSRLLHEGSYVPRLLGLDPSAAEVLQDDAGWLDPGTTLRQATGSEPIEEILGQVRTREYLRLAAREVEYAPLEEVGQQLSALVAACVQALLVEFELAERMVVFGMGKLGGDELNFLSDIDLIFVHEDPSGTPEAQRSAVVDLHDRLRRLVRHLEGYGRWRPLFRVDLRLRPFGARGPLSMSVSASEAYYERHGRPWERQVWLRARPIAGRIDLGELLVQRLTPFVYRRSVGPEIFSEIADMMRRARREATRVGARDAVDLKLDVGGIREIEFTIQALQLLHGGRNRSVRHTSTLPALDRLLAAGLVSDREHRDLSRAYRWLRRVEHRVQLADGQQTHRVPSDPHARELLISRLAWSAPPQDLTFESALEHHRHRAHSIAKTMAGDEEQDDAQTHDLRIVFDEGAPRSRRCAALERLGVHDPDQTEALLEHLYTRPDGPFTARGDARRGAENLLRSCLDSADPVAAIGRLVELAAIRPAHYGLWRAFARPNPVGFDLLRVTGELLGASEPLSRGLIGFSPGRTDQSSAATTPPDRILGLLSRAAEPTLPDTSTLVRDLQQQQPDPRGLDATLLHFKHEQMVRVGLYDLGRRPDPLEVGRSLSDIADIVVQVMLHDVVAKVCPTERFDLAVLALGKHGMQAMDYGSDLDLMFVFEAAKDSIGHEAQAQATRVAQQLMKRLESRTLGLRLYEVDMRLRPSGRAGLLVTSRTGFERYHARKVAVWERLALLRLRPVAEVRCSGPEHITLPRREVNQDSRWTKPMPNALPGELGTAVHRTAVHALIHRTQSAPSPSEIVQQTRRLRDRIERELARESHKAGWYNAKTGRGGCLELELLTAALQLIHGPDDPSVRSRGIIDALTELTAAGRLSAAEGSVLKADYRFYRLLLNRLRMSPGRLGDDPDRFSENSPRLVTLARRMGLPDQSALISRFQLARTRTRAAFDRRLPH